MSKDERNLISCPNIRSQIIAIFKKWIKKFGFTVIEYIGLMLCSYSPNVNLNSFALNSNSSHILDEQETIEGERNRFTLSFAICSFFFIFFPSIIDYIATRIVQLFNKKKCIKMCYNWWVWAMNSAQSNQSLGNETKSISLMMMMLNFQWCCNYDGKKNKKKKILFTAFEFWEPRAHRWKAFAFIVFFHAEKTWIDFQTMVLS